MLSVELYDVTLALDTSIYANGDVLSDTAVISNAVPVLGGRAILRSVVVLDEDDQGVALDLFLLGADVDLGTKNAAITITDADARNILGVVAVAAADFNDLINSKVATKTAVDMVLKAAAGSKDVYVSSVVRSGTPTFTASGIRLRLGIQWEGS